jgi:hypothetical protein
MGSALSAAVAAALTEALGQLVNAYLAERFKARAEGRSAPEFRFDPADFIKAYSAAKKDR